MSTGDATGDTPSTKGQRSAVLDERVDALRARCYRAAFVGRALRLTALALLLAGCAALATRVGLGLEGWPGWVGWAALLAVLPLAHVAARRQVPGRASAAAWLDAHGAADGSLVTAYELPDSAAWRAHFDTRVAAAPALPALDARTWRGPWPAALVFALVCPFVPVATPTPPPSSGVETLLETAVERAARRLEVLKEEVDLDEATAAELTDRLQRLERTVADAGLEAGFEGVDALERDIERAAEDAARSGEELARAMATASASSASDAAGSSEELERALEAARDGALAQRMPPELLERLERLVAEARALADAGGDQLSDMDDLERWLAFMEDWSEVDAELRAQIEDSLERLADAGLLGAQELEDRRAAMAAAADAALERLAEQLAEQLAAIDVDPEEAAAMREALADLPAAPELSSELASALERMQAELDEQLADAELPSGPDLVRLLAQIDPDLRDELFEALADLEARRAEAMQEAIELDPDAFDLDTEQLEALARALDAIKADLAAFFAQQLEGLSEPALGALARALAEASAGEPLAGEANGLDRDERDALAEALEDLGGVDPAELAQALTQIPPALRKQLAERLAQSLDGAARQREQDPSAAAPAPFDGLPTPELDALATSLAAIAEGLPVAEAPPLDDDQVRAAIEALRSMDPSLPGAGVP